MMAPPLWTDRHMEYDPVHDKWVAKWGYIQGLSFWTLKGALTWAGKNINPPTFDPHRVDL